MRAPHRTASQRGVAAVEFALVASLFFTMLFGVIDMGRLLWTWNAAAEATRLGARLAVVCDIGDADIKTRMIGRLPLTSTLTWCSGRTSRLTSKAGLPSAASAAAQARALSACGVTILIFMAAFSCTPGCRCWT